MFSQEVSFSFARPMSMSASPAPPADIVGAVHSQTHFAAAVPFQSRGAPFSSDSTRLSLASISAPEPMSRKRPLDADQDKADSYSPSLKKFGFAVLDVFSECDWLCVYA
jgi:hypothetical protein